MERAAIIWWWLFSLSILIASAMLQKYPLYIEFKPYHIAPQYSFSFEFCGVDNDLYKLLSEAYIDQIADASEFNL